MMRGVKELQGFAIAAIDGDVSAIEEVCFDNEKWTARHLVVETRGRLTGRKVPISRRSVVPLAVRDGVLSPAGAGLVSQALSDQKGPP